jgi:hypothetical protein
LGLHHGSGHGNVVRCAWIWNRDSSVVVLHHVLIYLTPVYEGECGGTLQCRLSQGHTLLLLNLAELAVLLVDLLRHLV